MTQTMAENRILITDVRIPLARFRKEFRDLDKLAASMGDPDIGQLQPIVLDDDNTLVAGERRYRAAMLLGWLDIWYVRKSQVSERKRRQMELEENVQRQEMEFWEVSLAVEEIHRLRREEDSSWNVEKTAEAVGLSRSLTYKHLELARELDTRPHLKEYEGIVGAINRLGQEKKLEEKKAMIEARVLPQRKAEVLCGDALALIRQQPAESFDCIVTNPPFGIDLDFIGQPVPYEDEEMMIVDLMIAMAPEMYRVLRPNSWLVSFFDFRKITYSNAMLRFWKENQYSATRILADVAGDLERSKDLYRAMGLAFWLETAGFSVNLMPCIWAKPNKRKGRPQRPGDLIVAYEALLFATKGDPPLLTSGHQNIFIFDTTDTSERIHQVQMPIDVCEEILSMIAPGGSRVLDPFAGSASIGIAALNRQCEFLGFELDPKKADLANTRLKAHELHRDHPQEAEDVRES